MEPLEPSQKQRLGTELSPDNNIENDCAADGQLEHSIMNGTTEESASSAIHQTRFMAPNIYFLQTIITSFFQEFKLIGVKHSNWNCVKNSCQIPSELEKFYKITQVGLCI